MSQVILLADSCCDMPSSFFEENRIPCISLSFSFKGKEWLDDMGQSISHADFYNALRQGEMATTSQINTTAYLDFFKRHVKPGQPALYLAFSSGLSGSCQSAYMAVNQLKEEDPGWDIAVVDSLAASMGEGLLLYYAVQLRDQEKGRDEIVKWLEYNKLRLAHWFTVEDLHHLKRGGRLSAASAVIGTLLHIKPVLHVDNAGHLIAMSKVRGRKKALFAIAQRLFDTIESPEDQVIFISHGDSAEDAEYLAGLIRERVRVQDIWIHQIGPVIGAHSGPGTVAVFYLGSSR
jgi:DegV family protein with EDD domain